MSPAEAAQLLAVSPHATPEEVETKFHELRTKLEDKISAAPTPGLKEKYRGSLTQITTAFETLVLAADASTLPVLQRETTSTAVPRVLTAPAPVTRAAPEPTRPEPRPRAAKGSREFLVVAVVAVVVLVGGGWWMLQVRAEKAEQRRLAAEAEAAAAQKAAAEKAEADRFTTQLRTQLAELNVLFDAQKRQESLAERELAELRNQERDTLRTAQGEQTPDVRAIAAQVRAQQRFVSWLHDTLPAHPATIARAKAEQLLGAGALPEASSAVDTYAHALDQLQQELAAAKAGTVVVGSIELEANQPGTTWKLIDAFGFEFTGTTPARLNQVAAGAAEVTFTRAPWPDQHRTVTVAAAEEATARGEFHPARLRVEVTPADATISVVSGRQEADGRWTLEPGTHRLVVDHPEFAPQYVTVRAEPAAELVERITLNQDFAKPALHLAMERLAQIQSDEIFYVQAESLARHLQEVGDRAAVQDVFAQMLRRPYTRLSGEPLGFSLYRIGIELGLKEEVRALVQLTDRLVAERVIAPLDEWRRDLLVESHAAALLLIGDEAAAEPYLQQFEQRRRQYYEQDSARRMRSRSFASIAGMLAIYDLFQEAEAISALARAAGADAEDFGNYERHFAAAQASDAIRKRRPQEAVEALRRSHRAALTELKADSSPHLRAYLHYSETYLAALEARQAGADELMEPLLAHYRELVAQDPIYSSEISQKQRTPIEDLLDPERYRARADAYRAERNQKFREALALTDAGAAVPKLLAIANDGRIYARE